MPREEDLEWKIAKLLRPSFTSYARGFNGMLYHGSWERVPRFMIAFKNGSRKASGSALWQAGLIEYDEVQGIEWEWQSVDGAMTKAPFGCASTGANPTDRSKLGVKRSLLTDGAGIPLAIIIDGANRHDVKQLCATLDGIVMARPEPSEEQPQHLCLDAVYTGAPALQEAENHRYLPHIRSRGQEKEDKT